MNDLKRKRGFTIISMAFMNGSDLDIAALKAMYKHFFPVAMEVMHNQTPYDEVKIWGYSGDFDTVHEGESIPQYEFTFTRVDENEVLVASVERVRK